MAKNPFQTDTNDAKRTHILDAAIMAIVQHGFQKLTIKKIAQQAGVADGTIYNYFKNKDAILLAVIGRITESEVRDIHFAEAEQMGFEEFIQQYVTYRMSEVEEGYPLLKVLLPEMITNPLVAEDSYDKLFGQGFDVATNFFSQLMEDGEMLSSDPTIAGRLFASTIMGLLTLRLLGDQHVAANWSAYSDALAAMMIRSLGNKGTEQ